MWKIVSICSLPDFIWVAQAVKQDSLHILTSMLLKSEVSFRIRCSELLIVVGV